MNKVYVQDVKKYIEAFRLRTLFLSLASIITGGLLPATEGSFSPLILLFTFLTTIALQILSNLANDYGDAKKGTDNVNRLGPQRTVQSGKVKASEMKVLIVIFSILSLFFGIILLLLSFSWQMIDEILLFLGLGLAAIWAAIKYTIGKKAFGYVGLGDVFVLLFFGIVGVFGSYYLQTRTLNVLILLPSVSIGLFAVGVLNLNNMRDIENDRACYKLTIPVRIGLNQARIYHALLLLIGWTTAIVFLVYNHWHYLHLLFISIAPIFIYHIKKVFTLEGLALDPLLKELSLLTCLFSVLFTLSFLVS